MSGCWLSITHKTNTRWRRYWAETRMNRSLWLYWIGPYGKSCKSDCVFIHLSAKEESEDKSEQEYATEFEDLFSHTASMFVEDSIALNVTFDSVPMLYGHYQIALPCRHEHKLPNNKKLAKRRHSCLKVRLIQDAKLLQDYVYKTELCRKHKW